MPIWKMVNGVLRKVNEIYRFNGSSWDRVIKANIPYGGVIVEHFTPRIHVYINANEANVDVFSKAGSPPFRCHVVVHIAAGVVVYSSSVSLPAITSGTGWQPNSTIEIINNGYIYGMGGAGGNGGYVASCVCYDGLNGQDGGDAIETFLDITVDNANGYIFGGGGGGGGASSMVGDYAISGTQPWGGGGGGGGQTYTPSSGGSGGAAAGCVSSGYAGNDGASGSTSGPGAGGSGPYDDNGVGGGGGAWGSPGQNGNDGTLTSSSATVYCRSNVGVGGAGGNAIRLNGKAITWVSGNTSTRVKGAVS